MDFRVGGKTAKSILQKVEKTIAAYQMIKAGDRILAAVSGGPDSTALLHMLKTIAWPHQFEVGVAHLNHGLRGTASDRDAEFTAMMARKYNFPFFSRKENLRHLNTHPRGSIEEKARNIRHAYLQEIACHHSYTKVALGHHQHDNAELVLMLMLRGSGGLGLSGMAPISPPNLIRPLIELSTKDISTYLRGHHLKWRIDASNEDCRFLRNKIRHQLLPHLTETYNPRLIETLNRSATLARDEEDWLASITQPLYEECIVDRSSIPNTCFIVLSVEKLRRLPKAAFRRIARKVIRNIKGDLRRIDYQHIEAIIELTAGSHKKREIHLPDRIRILREADELQFRRELKPLRALKEPAASVTLPLHEQTIPHRVTNPCTLYLNDLSIQLIFTPVAGKDVQNVCDAGQQVAFFDMDKLRFPLKVRTFLHGDRFVPLGMKGSQKVKKYLINRKVPQGLRSKIPILTDDTAIMWVVGYRMADFCKITANTALALRVEQKHLLNIL
jgi:tRNA(Ile)-lysidine synthase